MSQAALNFRVSVLCTESVKPQNSNCSERTTQQTSPLEKGCQEAPSSKLLLLQVAKAEVRNA